DPLVTGVQTCALPILKRLSFGLFMLGDRVRVHVLPKHYHTPIPDYRWLRRNRSLWAGRASVTGVHWDLDEQLRWIRDLCSPYYRSEERRVGKECRAGW